MSSKVQAVLERITWVLRGGHDSDAEGFEARDSPEAEEIENMGKKGDYRGIIGEEMKVGAREKIVVFSQWTRMLDVLQTCLSLTPQRVPMVRYPYPIGVLMAACPNKTEARLFHSLRRTQRFRFCSYL